MRLLTPVLLMLALCVAPGFVVAQGAAPATAPGVPSSSHTDSLFRAGEAVASYNAAMAHAARASTDYEALWRAARAETVRGVLSNDPRAEKAQMYVQGEGWARRAIARAPQRPEGHYWLAAALGRRARLEKLFTVARLAGEAHTEALKILAIDSLYAGGHGLLGKMHSDASDLSLFARVIASTILGASVVRTASWEAGERELLRAVALDPDAAVYRADLAQLYLRTHREPQADRVVRALLLLPVRTPADTFFKRDTRGALENYRAKR